MPTTRDQVLAFIRTHSLGVQASVSSAAASPAIPQAAVVGFVVTDTFELFFDTLESSRKIANLRQNGNVAFVIGGPADGDVRTVQYEGRADEPQGAELQPLKELYFSRFADGRTREAWPGITYVRVRPRWLRYSDYSQAPPEIIEWDFSG